MSNIVGIDLGTTNSRVALLRQAGGGLVVLPTIPTAVWLDEDGTALVGALAKQQAMQPGQPPPAMLFRRAMGTDDPVIAGHGTLTPLAASTHVLRHLKNLAEDALGVAVDRAVVTVPAFFEARARNEITQAGLDAGFEVIETLLEPVAAALTYTRDRELAQPRTLLVYDLGGATFDASVVSWDPDTGFEHRGFDGDRFLGGSEFDNDVVRWMAEQLPKHDLRVIATLLPWIEKAKHELTVDSVATVTVTSGTDRSGIPLRINLPIRRDTFEELIEPRIRSTIERCDRALDSAGQPSLDEILMVGGSSRIPLVARLLREHYQVQPVMIEPDLCVAIGAAIKAASDAQRPVVEHATNSPVAVEADADVLTKDIAVELPDGPFVIGPAGTKLPYRTTFSLETANQGVLLRVRLFEGPLPIGEVEVRELPRELPVGTRVVVEVELQRNGTIQARASVPAAGPHAVGTADITISRVVLPSWDQLRKQYEEVSAGWQNKRLVANPVDLMRFGPELDALLTEIEPLLDERLDGTKTHNKLQEADTRLRRISLGRKELQPPWAEFDAKLSELDRLCDELTEQKSRPYKNGIPGLRDAGRKAHETQNKVDWSAANEAVDRQIMGVRESLKGPTIRRPITASEIQENFLAVLTGEIESVRKANERSQGRHHAEADKLIAGMRSIVTELGLVDAYSNSAIRELQKIYNNSMLPMGSAVNRWLEKAGEPNPGSDEVILPRRPQWNAM